MRPDFSGKTPFGPGSNAGANPIISEWGIRLYKMNSAEE